ncbi:MAG: T9SS type A sorting domain-containing protein [Ignavibacteriae bacterium]|nr:T9SS type A sorting domain-containing protein [Ignavibacteriota bacterium]
MNLLKNLLIFFVWLLAIHGILPAQANPWHDINSLTSSHILGVCWGDATHVVAVGTNSLILYSTNSGDTWNRTFIDAGVYDHDASTSIPTPGPLQPRCNTANYPANFYYNLDRKSDLQAVASAKITVSGQEQISFLAVGENDSHQYLLSYNFIASPWLLFSKDFGVTWMQLARPETIDVSAIPSGNQAALNAMFIGNARGITGELRLNDVKFNNTDNRWYICGGRTLGNNNVGIIFSIPVNASGDPDCAEWRMEYFGYLPFISLDISPNGNIFCAAQGAENLVSNDGTGWAISNPNDFKTGFTSNTVNCVPGTNDQVFVGGCGFYNMFDGALASRMAHVSDFFNHIPPSLTAPIVQQRITCDNYDPNSTTYNPDRHLKFGQIHSFSWTKPTTTGYAGYALMDFGRMIFVSEGASLKFSDVYRTNNEVILSPAERLYCSAVSPNTSGDKTIVVGGAFGNLWVMKVDNSGKINNSTIVNRNLTLASPNQHVGISEIFDMTSVGNRIYMVGESGKIAFADVSPTSSPTIELRQFPTDGNVVFNNFNHTVLTSYTGGKYDFHGIYHQTATTPVINRLWIVGQNGMLLSGDLSPTTDPKWTPVLRSNIHLTPPSGGALHSNANIHLNSIVFSSDIPCLGYAVGGNSLILRTTDGGTTWRQVNLSVTGGGVPENTLYKIIYNNQRFIIVGDRVILRSAVFSQENCSTITSLNETWTRLTDVADGATPTGSFVDLLDNLPPAPGTNYNQRHLVCYTGSNPITITPARYILRNVAAIKSPTHTDYLIACGYLENAALSEGYDKYSTGTTKGLILISTNNGSTWNEVLPVSRGNDKWLFENEEKSYANARFFGITTLNDAVWISGGGGYIIRTTDLTANNGSALQNTWNMPCTSTPFTGTPYNYVGEWGDIWHKQINSQTSRSLNAICVVPNSNASLPPILVAAGAHGTIIATTHNNNGLGKNGHEEESSIFIAKPQLFIAPNPVNSNTDQISVEFTTDNPQETQMEYNLLNGLGQVVFSSPKPIELGNNSVSVTIPVQRLAAGVYFVCVKTTISTYCEKVLINH